MIPLLPLLLGVAPTVASWVMGDKGGNAVAKVTSIAKDILGTDDPLSIEKAISQDPELALRFKTQLIQAEADARRLEHEEVVEMLRDMQSARDQTVKLAQMGSGIAWGAPAVSVLSIILAGAVAYLVLFPQADAQKWTEVVVTMLVGAAINWVGTVQNYWLGSSKSSADKNELLAKLRP